VSGTEQYYGQDVFVFIINIIIIYTVMFFTAILITYIKGGNPAQIYLEKGSAMMRATFVFFFTEVLRFY
jgi:hypothetical protein